MKKTILLIALIMVLLSNMILAQNKIFLERKGFYDEKLNLPPWQNVASVSSDNTYLALGSSTYEYNSKTTDAISFNNIGVINLETGRVEKINEAQYGFFLGNNLYYGDYSSFNGKKMKNTVLLEKMGETPQYLLDYDTKELTEIDLPKGHSLANKIDEYILTMHMNKSGIFKKEKNKLKEIAILDIKVPDVSEDKQYIYGTNIFTKKINIYEFPEGKIVNDFSIKNSPIQVYLTKDKKIITTEMEFNRSGNHTYTINLRDFKGKILKEITASNKGNLTFRLNSDESEMITANQNTGEIKLWSLPSCELLASSFGAHIDAKSSVKKYVKLSGRILDGKFYTIGYSNGLLSLYSSAEKKIVADIFMEGEDWAVIARDGRVEGTPGAFKKLEWQEYDSNDKLLRTTSLEATYNNFYTPRLLYSILNEEIKRNNVLTEQLVKTPKINILKPNDGISTSEKEIIIDVKAVSKGDPIDKVLLYVNGKLVSADKRGFIKAESQDFESLTVSLFPGENIISAKAVTKNMYESEIDEIKVTYKSKPAEKSNLYLLVIGLNKYKNPKYNLNYALADAQAFKETVENGTGSIFENVNVSFITDADATKSRILLEFEKINANTKQEDVFILYYAGHGVMSEEKNAQFYMIPHDVTQLYGNNELLKTKAISANELQDLSANLKAQKQMFVLDACQSGGMTERLAMRGVAEEKAIAQLARSTGTYWLTASGSEQFATEFAELGHGVFTYAVLLGLQGQADGGAKDKKITVKEISAFLNDMVPELSEKHKGEAQYPTSYGYGQDFPIVIVK